LALAGIPLPARAPFKEYKMMTAAEKKAFAAKMAKARSGKKAPVKKPASKKAT
jgi:hypothetical protein